MRAAWPLLPALLLLAPAPGRGQLQAWMPAQGYKPEPKKLCGCQQGPCRISPQQAERALTDERLVGMCRGPATYESDECRIRHLLVNTTRNAAKNVCPKRLPRAVPDSPGQYSCGPLCRPDEGHGRLRCAVDPGEIFKLVAGVGREHPMWTIFNAPAECARLQNPYTCGKTPLCTWQSTGQCTPDTSTLLRMLLDRSDLLALVEQATPAMLCRARQQFAPFARERPAAVCESSEAHKCRLHNGICTFSREHTAFPIHAAMDALCRHVRAHGQCPGFCSRAGGLDFSCRGPSAELDADEFGLGQILHTRPQDMAARAIAADRQVVLTAVVMGSATQLYEAQCNHLNLREEGARECALSQNDCMPNELPEYNELVFDNGYDPEALVGEILSPANFGDPEVLANLADSLGLHSQATTLERNPAAVAALAGRGQDRTKTWLRERPTPGPAPASPPLQVDDAGGFGHSRPEPLRWRRDDPGAGSYSDDGGAGIGLLAIALVTLAIGVACACVAVGILVGAPQLWSRGSRELTPSLLASEHLDVPMQPLAGGPE